MGLCVRDYFQGDYAAEVVVHSNLEEPTFIRGEYLFRSVEEMPPLEQLALRTATGRVLDVGACSGCHALPLQQNGLTVETVDLSQYAVETMRSRGLIAHHADIFAFTPRQPFDTILLLMNGLGMGGSLESTRLLLLHLRDLLEPGGTIIGDSADILQSYAEDDGSILLEVTGRYYGVVDYQLEYRGQRGKVFNWLFLAWDKLAEIAEHTGFALELLAEGETDDYLAKLTRLD